MDTDASTFRALIGKFRRNLRPGDVSLFYFAGHGLQANGENYLLPVDAALQRPADLALEAERLQDIIAAMTAEENIAIVLLDACRDNPFVKQLSGPGQSRGLAIGKGLGPWMLAGESLSALQHNPATWLSMEPSIIVRLQTLL
ncbi:MAG: hypothetical protein E5X98_08065 [Mesorhizobium sp.]|nr:MAG: hypothetical protein E5X98_08065 [Mesorhizobium sp.]